MNDTLVNQTIQELIELSDTKYGLLKVGRDTLQTDIVFIEKYETLKTQLGINSFDDIDMTQFPIMRELKQRIEKINSLDEQKMKRNVRKTKATSAYKKRMER
jgi:hypothetical protein